MPGTILLNDAGGLLELAVLERMTSGQAQGDLRLSVSVRADDFAGKYDQVWISKDDWMEFIGSLIQLEQQRRGKATLASMSPREFQLHLQIMDPAGHLAVHGRLSRLHRARLSGDCRSHIEYCLDVDPGLLRELVESFKAIGS